MNEKNILVDIPLRMDAEIIIASLSNRKDFYSLYSLFNLGSPPNHMKNIGFYNGQFNFYENNSFYSSHRNLTGVTIKSASVVKFVTNQNNNIFYFSECFS